MNILRYIQIILDFSFTNFLLFSTLKNKPSRSWRYASGVKEKCFRGQREVRGGSKKSASGVKEKCFSGSTSPWPPMHFALTPDALLLDHQRNYPWLLTHFSLTPDALILDLQGGGGHYNSLCNGETVLWIYFHKPSLTLLNEAKMFVGQPQLHRVCQ